MPKIFIVDDNPMYAAAIENSLKEFDYEVKVFYNGADLLNHLNENPDIVTLDYNLPDFTGMDLLKKITKNYSQISTIMLSGQEDLQTVVDTYNNGAKNYIIKNDNAIVELKNAIKNLVSSISLKQEVEVLREEITDRNKYSNIVGESSAIFKVLKLIQRVEKTDSLVMITGDSGTGKEVVAEAIHINSLRRKKPFVAVNLAAIPTHLIEDELFGHEKGAFTGAVSKRIGKFEEAEGGTIFLDEIGELEISLQTKLLRVLQEKNITRLGSNKLINLNVRIVTATNKNLSEQVKLGKFREDLYYRIQGFLIHLPKLRERGNDIIVLAKHFLNLFTHKHKIAPKQFDESAINAMLKHNWPGNVRELIAFVERTALMSDSNIITKNDLIFSESI
ncbi:MAG: sigma-54-dependent Fis family transcriptional regulator [Bacteroidetes bacterium]|nr:sigma-54-dependent Fis family transcriptional regulator [Bacteroidota bacterium]